MHQRLFTNVYLLPMAVRKVKVQSSSSDKGKKKKRQMLLHFTKQNKCFLSAVVLLNSDRAPTESCDGFKGRRKLCIKLQGHKSA